ncbi:putative RNA-directed DNA polymerase [Helianthus annuus]|nr:putative RNA-directed DNA polymerase [Helianthus annuus]KAJ0625923.1 putative RNA-directed DNA polymerase [Helianthus annuus]KAJ0782277.1 putative RNA-directed DNA polymerase [Helianthus annuus]
MYMMGFLKRWRRWINACLKSSKASVLVNGSPTDEFYLKRGLRQGDPLSPFLFVLALEVLEVFIKRATSLGLFNGVQLPNGGPNLTHLCYADDVIFMGLKVNLSKSSLMGVGVEHHEVENMATVIWCKTGSIPFKFLGLPIGDNMKRISPWKPIIDKFAKRLSSWKAKTLSLGGRITLAKAVLGNLPSYFLSIFKAPVKVLKTLEGLRRDFVWGKTGSKCKMRWVAWNKIQAPRRFCGLGLGEMRSLNWALLMKWRWRFKSDPNQFWARVVMAIHGDHGEVDQVPLKISLTGAWKDTVFVAKDLRKAGIDNPELLGLDEKNNTFSLTQFRGEVAERIGEKVELGKVKWNNWVPHKVGYFVWKLSLGCICF